MYIFKSNNKQDLFYTEISNNIIEFSCNYHHFVLPVFAYSKIYCNRGYVVNTTIEAITKAFYGDSYDKRSKKHEEITEALLLLCDDFISDGKLYLSPLLMIDENYTQVNWEDQKHGVGYRTPIRYEQIYIGRDLDYHFTKLSYAEFDYIFGWCIDKNLNLKKGETKIESVVLFNLYMLLKLFIERNKAVTKLTDEKRETYLPIATLAKKMNCSTRTIQFYLRLLEEMELITIKKGDFSKKRANKYYLNDNWYNQFEQLFKDHMLGCQAVGTDGESSREMKYSVTDDKPWSAFDDGFPF